MRFEAGNSLRLSCRRTGMAQIRLSKSLTNPSSQTPGPFGLRGNRREKLAQNLLRGDERRSRQVHGHGGAGPRIAREEDRDPIERVRKDLFHFFGVPYT